ncbi:hypothetical protein [Streptomyces sp. NPDC059165]|uniref:hypothetical protein n=1 Tax=Streptomyces sp. NPDC059165 TaxID=3346751 RepID=UPI0036B79164
MTADLSAPVLNLLAAMGEALDVPAPALDRDAEAEYRLLVEDRIRYVRCVIKAVVAGETGGGIEWEADYLRRKTAERPVTYRTNAQVLAEREEGRS